MSLGPSDESNAILLEYCEDCFSLLDDCEPHMAELARMVVHEVPFDAHPLEQIRTSLASILESARFLQISGMVHLVLPVENDVQTLMLEPDHLTEERFDYLKSSLMVLQESVALLRDEGQAALEQMVGGLPATEPVEQPKPTNVESLQEPDFNSFEMEFTLTITPDMMKTFIHEAEEQLEVTETSLLHMEQDFSDRESLDAAFRAMHTFKGNCGLFSFDQMEQLGHQFETILEELKAGEIAVEQHIISMLLSVLDKLKHKVHDLHEGKDGKFDNFDTLLTTMTEFREKGHVLHVMEKGQSSLLGEILVERGLIKREDLDVALTRQSMPLGEILKEMNLVNPTGLETALQLQDERRQLETGSEVKRASTSQNIRVDLQKLDTLINLVGELIIAENMVVHNPDLENHIFENFRKATLHLNRISRELQDVAMSLRMVTIESTFRKMTRVVRDVAQKQGKIVDLVMRGEDTEVDKNVAENIASPLLHLIRNAIDHGIERPEVRERSGKPRKGSIWLTALHDGGEVVLEIRDDGAGIDTQKVRKKAIERNLIDEHTEFETEQELFQLIFEPGFSTAEQVTDISGRGVGMDVVKRSIEAISGRVAIESHIGSGTTFRISIPLTLAIIEGMLVRVDYQLFTIPLLSIRETIKVNPDQVSRTIDGSEMVKIRERLIPVVKLSRLFIGEDRHSETTAGTLVIVEMHGERAALLVDEIRGQYQTVIKGMSAYLENVRGVSGTSILSNGDISLILDIQSLLEWATQLPSADPVGTHDGLGLEKGGEG